MAEVVLKQRKRPKNLDLKTIRLPLPGIVSILHRISGAGLFIMLPLILWLFQSSLTNAETFEAFKGFFNHVLGKALLGALLLGYVYHFCAGLRFIALDFHMGLDLEAARMSSKVVLVAAVVITVIIGASVL